MSVSLFNADLCPAHTFNALNGLKSYLVTSMLSNVKFVMVLIGSLILTVCQSVHAEVWIFFCEFLSQYFYLNFHVGLVNFSVQFQLNLVYGCALFIKVLYIIIFFKLF